MVTEVFSEILDLMARYWLQLLVPWVSLSVSSERFANFFQMDMQVINGRKKSAKCQQFHLQIFGYSHAKDTVNTTPRMQFYTSTKQG